MRDKLLYGIGAAPDTFGAVNIKIAGNIEPESKGLDGLGFMYLRVDQWNCLPRARTFARCKYLCKSLAPR